MASERGRYVPTHEALQKYGITREYYEELFVAQGGLCKICAMRPIAAIDHYHQTEEFRGLLCTRCNMGLGYFKDNAQSLYNAPAYLTAHRVQSDGAEEEEQEFYDPSVPRQP